MKTGFDNLTADRRVREDIDLIVSSPAPDDPSLWCAAYDRLLGFQRRHMLTKVSFVGSYLVLAALAGTAIVEVLPEAILPIAAIAVLVGLYFVDNAADALFRDRTTLSQNTVHSLLIVVDRWRAERRRLNPLMRN